MATRIRIHAFLEQKSILPQDKKDAIKVILLGAMVNYS